MLRRSSKRFYLDIADSHRKLIVFHVQGAYAYVPADDEKKNGTSPWTTWFQWISAAEAFGCDHDKHLTGHEE